MNEFEDKLRSRPLRPAPADLRVSVFRAAAKIAAPRVSAWREWFWPSPAAWVALAAVWLVLALIRPLFVSENDGHALSAAAAPLRPPHTIEEMLISQR
jgi:hypothetical protein